LMIKLSLPVPAIVKASVVVVGMILIVDSSVMVCGVEKTPTVSKLIVSFPAVVFAIVMASRSEPAPASLVLITKKLAGVQRSSSAWSKSRFRSVFGWVAGVRVLVDGRAGNSVRIKRDIVALPQDEGSGTLTQFHNGIGEYDCMG